MPLITTDELEAFMGRDFTESEAAQAGAIIDQVSFFIEDEAGVLLTHMPNDVIIIQADGHGIIELNSRPINSVDSVKNVDGDEIDCWEWDGLAAVYGLFPNQVVTLTYDHGFETVPGRLKAVALGVASRVMYNPSGLRQETVGAISVTYPGIGGEAGTINFTDLERKVLDRYAGIGKSLRLSIQQRRLAALPILTIDNDID
jgi:hypothetical protein